MRHWSERGQWEESIARVMTAAEAPSPVPSPSDRSASDAAASAPSLSGQDGPLSDAGAHPHNFEVQKEIHQKIRNDPDYDDWEYGTEPLPQEAWVARQRRSLDASGDPL